MRRAWVAWRALSNTVRPLKEYLLRFQRTCFGCRLALSTRMIWPLTFCRRSATESSTRRKRCFSFPCASRRINLKSKSCLTLCLAKIEKAFEMDDIQRDSVTCYMDENHGVAEFWRTTGATFKPD